MGTLQGGLYGPHIAPCEPCRALPTMATTLNPKPKTLSPKHYALPWVSMLFIGNLPLGEKSEAQLHLPSEPGRYAPGIVWPGQGLGVRVWGLGFRVWGWFGVWG